jgi:hypothetical protein
MALVVIRVPEETSVLRPQHWLKVAKSTHLLQRVFERPCRGILDGDRHLFLAFYGFKLNKIFLKYSLVSPVVVSLYREASQVSLFHTCEGAACCVDAHLPTVDERFRTCLQ